MKKSLSILLGFILSFLIYSCEQNQTNSFVVKELYSSDSLKINQIDENSYQHISYLKTESFGLVSCNGLVVVDGDEAIIFDTPTSNFVSKELLKWLETSLDKSLKAVVVTHFHNDCLGGLETFHAAKVPSYASFKTIALAKKENLELPKNGFEREKKLKIGKNFVDLSYFGEGHTKDNTVGYFPKDKILFGGCLIKEVGASKGYLGDSNEKDWAKTVKNVKLRYPNLKTVVPGHGEIGGMELLDYTIELFSK